MKTQPKPVFLCIFLFPSFSLSSFTPLQYQTFLLTSLPQSQTLPWASEQKSDELETLPVSGSGFSADFHHVDTLSPASNSTSESLFKLHLQRDGARVKALSAAAAAAAGGNVSGKARGQRDFSSSVISRLAQGSGEYFTRIDVGTSTKYVYMVLDTGSDVVWIQCSPCRKCYSQSDPVFDPRKLTSFLGVSCASPLCRRLDSPGCNSRRKCLYQFSYGNGSFTVGDFSTETLMFRKARVKNVALGCGHDNERLFVGAADLLGLAGVDSEREGKVLERERDAVEGERERCSRLSERETVNALIAMRYCNLCSSCPPFNFKAGPTQPYIKHQFCWANQMVGPAVTKHVLNFKIPDLCSGHGWRREARAGVGNEGEAINDKAWECVHSEIAE